MREEGWNVGHDYETHGDIWDADSDTVQIGLLHLILDRLMEMGERPDPLERHSVWLKNYRSKASETIEEHEKQRARLVAMFGPDANLGSDVNNEFDIHRLARSYRASDDNYRRKMDCLEGKIERMKSVRKPKDVTNLEGIGPHKASRILKAKEVV